MKLAKPAPKVEGTEAEAPEASNTVKIESAKHSAPVLVDDAPRVKSARVGDGNAKDYGEEITTASVVSAQVLRGAGADFEGKAAVLRGAPEKSFLKKALPFFFDERDFVAYGEVVRYILVKGNACFVFGEENDSAPLYAIPLDEIKPIMENSKKHDKFSVTISPTANANRSNEDMVTVLFKYKNGRLSKEQQQAYQFTFDTHEDKSLAKRFFDTVERASRSKTPNTASVVRANQIGKKAAKAQPSKSINS